MKKLTTEEFYYYMIHDRIESFSDKALTHMNKDKKHIKHWDKILMTYDNKYYFLRHFNHNMLDYLFFLLHIQLEEKGMGAFEVANK